MYLSFNKKLILEELLQFRIRTSTPCQLLNHFGMAPLSVDISAVFPEDNVSDKFEFLHKQQSSHQPNILYAIGDFVNTSASVSKHKG